MIDGVYEESKTRDLIAKLSGYSADALRVLKRAIHTQFDFDTALAATEKLYLEELMKSPDPAAAVAKFLTTRQTQ